MRRSIVWLWLFIPCLLVSDQLYAQQTDNPTTLMVLGDSLSAGYGLRQEQGWVSLLQNAFKPQGIRVVNAAISGETTDGGLARLPRLLEQHQPTHLLIELGGNDGLQGHNVKKIRTNLDSMIEIAKQQGVEVFLQAMQIPTNYGPRYNQLFQDVFYQAGDAHSIPVIPFFLTEIALQPELMQRDGIHPKAEAQPQIAAFMQQQLQPLLQAPVSHSGTQ